MAESDSDVNATGEFDQTLLHVAADRGNVQRIHELLRDGADLEARDLDGYTPLMIAVSVEEPEAVDRLLEAGADLSAQNYRGDTALHIAAENNNPGLTARLLESNANPNLRNQQGRTPIHSVATGLSPNGTSSSPIETIELLQHSGADIDAQDSSGNTALHFVALGRSPEAERIAEAMLQRGADSSIANMNGRTPVDFTDEPRDRPDSVHANRVKDTIIQYNLRADARSQTRDSGQDSVTLPDRQSSQQPHVSSDFSNDADAIRVTGLSRQDLEHSESMDQAPALNRSAAAGDLEQVDRLLKEGANPNTRSADGRTPLHEAVDYHTEIDDPNSYRLVNRLLKGGANPNLQDSYYEHTPLHRAIHAGSPVIAKQLLDFGADPSIPDADRATPLHLAAKYGDNRVVEHLLQSGSDVHARDNKGNTALHLAAETSNPDLTARLLEAGTRPEAYNDNLATPLHAIATHTSQVGHSGASIETMDLLLHSGADLDIQDKDGNTALHYVAEGRVPDANRIAEAMLQRNAQISLANKNGLTALETASKDRDGIAATYSLEVKNTIEEYQSRLETDRADRIAVDPFEEHRSHELGAQTDSVSERYGKDHIDHEENLYDHNTELHTSAAAGHPFRVNQLLLNGADPNARDPNGRTALHEAVDARNYETVDRLLTGGANPNLQDHHLRQSSLHRAVENQNDPITARLLQAGANPNLRDASGDTPLHAALKSPHLEREPLATLNNMIARNAQLDLADMQNRSTPLHIAAETNKVHVAQRLLSEQVDPNVENKNGATPLHIAAENSREMTLDLLYGGASPHSRDENGMTPLHRAAMSNQADCVTHLVDRGGDPNSRNMGNETPLHLSAYCGSHEATERLIQCGANVHARDENGITPLHNAADANCTKSIDYLLNAGADIQAHIPGKFGTPLEQAQELGNTAAVERLTQAETAREKLTIQPASRIQRIINRIRPYAKDEPPEAELGRLEVEASSKLTPEYIDSKMQEYYQQQGKEHSMPQEHWSNSKSARDHTQEVATRVARQIEKGTASFQKGYDKPKGADLQPFNPATGKRFKGLNAIQLKSVAQEKGFSDPRWMSFRTANRIGAKIRKGERGTRVEYLRFPPKAKVSPEKQAQGKDAPNGASGGEKEKEAPKISHHTYVVFNAEQVERMPSLEQQLPKEPQQHEVCERAERMIAASNVKIDTPKNGQDYSNYDKQRDTIELPNIEKFKSPEQYYGHAASEMASRAAHEQQKNRPEPQSEAQQFTADSRREMRREMATDTICSKMNLPKQPTGDKCKTQWAENIRKNPNELRYAARDADRMADKVLQHDKPQLRLPSEQSRSTPAPEVSPERVQQTQRNLQQQQQPEREAAAMSR